MGSPARDCTRKRRGGSGRLRMCFLVSVATGFGWVLICKSLATINCWKSGGMVFAGAREESGACWSDLGAEDVRRARTAKSEMGELSDAEGWLQKKKGGKKENQRRGGEEEGGKEKVWFAGCGPRSEKEREIKRKEKIRKRNEER